MRRSVLALALLALVIAGCGNAPNTGTDSAQEGSAVADTEGIYLDINHLKYQIQLSRYMNPNDVEDAEYLKGLPKGEAQPSGTDTWFGVWVRVQNVTDQAHAIADNWEIRDTLGKIYRPIPIDTNVNVFALDKTIVVPPHTVIPLP